MWTQRCDNRSFIPLTVMRTGIYYYKYHTSRIIISEATVINSGGMLSLSVQQKLCSQLPVTLLLLSMSGLKILECTHILVNYLFFSDVVTQLHDMLQFMFSNLFSVTRLSILWGFIAFFSGCNNTNRILCFVLTQLRCTSLFVTHVSRSLSNFVLH